MTLHAALTHVTTYTYDRAIGLSPQVIRLRPAPHARTPILAYSLRVEPKAHFINWQQDPFGNYQARVVFQEKTKEFKVTVDLIADMAVINPFDFFVEDSARDFPFTYEAKLKTELAPYLEKEPVGPALQKWLSGITVGGATTVDFLTDLNRKLHGDIGYIIRMEPGVQTCEETLEKASGSCRDSAWLLVQILRNLGVAARFVSGYLIQLTPDVKSLDGPSGTDVDFTDLHAWTEAFIPGAGWIGLDPTSGLLTGEGHIPLACTPNFTSAAPITGAHDKAEVTFGFDMTVKRLEESARVTKPYSDEQWTAIRDAGHLVDARLKASDVRLTMGGEPTFISIDDMDGAEWNTEATGPNKRRYAETLVRRLRDRFAPGGLLHYGQGKWYPGEQLPRWAFAVYWRGDGEPLWLNHELIDREVPVRQSTIADAERFAQTLTRRLGVATECAVPAFEDAAHFMLVEQKLPLNVSPLDNRLEDPQERARVIRTFDRGITEPTSYVLPIQVWQAADARRRWVSERWAFRRERLYLVPGDSPAGFRLPLGSLPYISPINYPHVYPLDPTAQRAPLPAREILLRDRRGTTLIAPTAAPLFPNEVFGSVRTALAIEPRDGHLCVFMPPLYDAEDYASLVAALEDSAAETGLPLHLEGYPPPPDHRLQVIKVTPDPGVIEVNIQPARSWDDAVAITEGLYEEARLSRLGTDKFMLDGRHTGTGGGNHIVLGGATPSDSPFLRRPDLLRSVIGYWQNHPSLSYLFSGLFIGPTSQAPRIDEARHDSLYELDIAFKQVPEPGLGYLPPWLVDRLFRHLLVDVTGNTHRAEICIDKLYSPDSSSGRLGLIEFRSFEMPPHSRMSLAQQLLLRALIAWFWEKPYKKPLQRWGTQLHDKFMLPEFVWLDFLDVIGDLKAAGYPLSADWFRAHYEFRFPLYGHVTQSGIAMELRQALEPWHVLGEEGAVGGTARYVDSSLERMQVKVSGVMADRHSVTCNGVPLPLQPTRTQGEMAAGIRFRAWWPASCLHPTIGIHTPLTIELVDDWNKRSLGGCRYHVFHPGGRAFDTFPVNAYEAEGRRLARFEPMGHTPGTIQLRPVARSAEFPYTLDLRQFSV